MSDDFLNQFMGGLADAVEAELAQFGDEVVAGIRDLISIPVEHVGGQTIRSKRGEAPRRETGNLSAGIRHTESRPGPDLVQTETTADATYADNLEIEKGRPFLSTAAERYGPQAEPRLAAWAATFTGPKTP